MNSTLREKLQEADKWSSIFQILAPEAIQEWNVLRLKVNSGIALSDEELDDYRKYEAKCDQSVG